MIFQKLLRLGSLTFWSNCFFNRAFSDTLIFLKKTERSFITMHFLRKFTRNSIVSNWSQFLKKHQLVLKFFTFSCTSRSLFDIADVAVVRSSAVEFWWALRQITGFFVTPKSFRSDCTGFPTVQLLRRQINHRSYLSCYFWRNKGTWAAISTQDVHHNLSVQIMRSIISSSIVDFSPVRSQILSYKSRDGVIVWISKREDAKQQ